MAAVLILTGIQYDSIVNAAEAGTMATEITNVKVEGTKLTLYLSEHDYGTETNEAINLQTFAYNALSYIELYYTDGTSGALETAGTVTAGYYNALGEGSVTIEFASELKQIKKVVIKAGCELPSKAYTNGSAEKLAYVVESETVFETITSGGSTYWTQETEVSNIHIRTGAKTELLLFTTINDYGTGETETMNVAKFVGYNTLNNIELHDTSGNVVSLAAACGGAGYYNLWEKGCAVVELKDGLNPIEKVVIKAGCELPSKAYTNGSAEKLAYVVKEETVFKANEEPTDNSFSVSWTKEVTPDPEPETPVKTYKDTEISNIHIRTGMAGAETENSTKLLLFLFNNDYGTESNVSIDITKFAGYNTLGYIELHDNAGTVKTLKDVCEYAGFYNVWGESGSVAIQLKDGLNPITKVVIKAGCELPSKAYTNENSSEKVIYVVQKDTVFNINGIPTDNSFNTSWTKEQEKVRLPLEEKVTNISNIHVRTGEHTELLLFLSENDYGTDSTVSMDVSRMKEYYNTLENIVLYTTSGKELTLADVFGNAAHYNIWGEKGSVAIELKDGLDPICKVVIKEGCQFPSRAFTEGTATTQLTYVVEQEITFTASETPKDNSMSISWSKEVTLPTENKDTEVKEAYLSGRDGDVRLILTLSAHDYKGIGNNISLGDKFTHYNTLDKIVLCAGDKEVPLSKVISDEVYFNLWGREGSISYGLKSEYKVSSFDAIIIKAGCEFPSYDYISNDVVDSKVTFKTVEEKKVSIVAVQNQQEQDEEETPSVESSKTTGSGNVFSSASQITYVEGEGSGQDAVTDDDVKPSTDDDVDAQNEVKDDDATDGETSGKVNLGKVVVPAIVGVLLIGIIVWLLARKKSKDKDKE